MNAPNLDNFISLVGPEAPSTYLRRHRRFRALRRAFVAVTLLGVLSAVGCNGGKQVKYPTSCDRHAELCGGVR